jgi:hypothetical protein
MQGNLHVQFLRGGQARATASGYPADTGVLRAMTRLQTKGTQSELQQMLAASNMRSEWLASWRAQKPALASLRQQLLEAQKDLADDL